MISNNIIIGQTLSRAGRVSYRTGSSISVTLDHTCIVPICKETGLYFQCRSRGPCRQSAKQSVGAFLLFKSIKYRDKIGVLSMDLSVG